MTRIIADQNDFSAGEISADMQGRTDGDFYKRSLASMLNYLVLPTGGVTRRPGTQFVCEIEIRDPSEYGPGTKTYTAVVSQSVNNLNLLRDLFDNRYDPAVYIVTIKKDVVVGSANTEACALDTGVFAPDSKVILNLEAGAYISGAGGQGGASSAQARLGGPALNLSYPLSVSNGGVIQSGGAGAKGQGAGGGAGAVGGAGGDSGSPGVLTQGGAGGVYMGQVWVPPVYSGSSGGWTYPTLVQEGYWRPVPVMGAQGGEPGSATAVVTNGHGITWRTKGTVLGSIS